MSKTIILNRAIACHSLILILMITTARGQSPATGRTAQTTWTDHYRKATVSIGKIDTIGTTAGFVAIGTGVIVAKKFTSGRYAIALATAKHNLEGVDAKSIRVRFAFEEQKSLEEDIGYDLPIRSKSNQKLWIDLGQQTDLAIIPLNLQFSIASLTITDAISTDDFATADDVFQSQPIFFFGFPDDVSVLMGKDALVRAVMRVGVVSWTNPTDPSKPFLIDANVLGGNSGSAVISQPTGMARSGTYAIGQRILLLGLITDTVANSYVTGIGGLGRVEPAWEIKVLLDRMFPGY